MYKYIVALAALMIAMSASATQESIKFGPVTDEGQSIPNDGVVPNGQTLTECVMLMAASATLPASNPPARSVIDGTNFDYSSLAFDDATDETAYWNFELPKNFTGTTATVTTSWTAAACTVETADVACWQINGGGFKGADAFKGATLSGTATAGEDQCDSSDDDEIMFGPGMLWTHGIDSTEGSKDTFATFKINRDTGMQDAECGSSPQDNPDVREVLGDVQLLGVRICYETDNSASGENTIGRSSIWDTAEWGNGEWR